MSFREVLRYEVARQRRSPATWLYVLLLLALPIVLVAGGSDPAVGTFLNAPVKLATFVLFVGLLGTLITAALFVEAADRDRRWRMDRLFYTAPLAKSAYLGGRFLGVLLVNALLLLAAPVGLLLSTLLPTIRPEVLGPLRLEAYALPYVLLLLPNLLVNAAVLFGVTALSRRSLPGYLAGVGLLAAYLVGLNAAVGQEGSLLFTLLDPTGGVALTGLTKGWTRVELNTRLVAVAGPLLWNRLLWTALGAAMLAFTYRRFRLAQAEARSGRRWLRRRAIESATPVEPSEPVSATHAPAATRAFGARAGTRQAIAVAWIGFRQIMLRREFLFVMAGLFLLALFAGTETLGGGESGEPLWPRTHELLPGLTGTILPLVTTLLVAFYAGELIWRTRDAGMDSIADSVPVRDWVPLVGTFLALGLMLLLMQSLVMAAGLVLQVARGYTTVELGLYVAVLFGLQLADYLLFAAVAIVVHAVVDQKYVGHLVAPLLYVLTMFAGRVGLEHNLLIYGSDAGWVYSDLAGFGPYLRPWLWFKLYWAGWALLLGVVARLFWVRGAERGLRGRLRLARRRLTPPVGAAAGAAALLVLGAGGWVFYNTNVRTAYRTAWEADAVLAEHERRYKRFEHAAQPWLTGMRLHVELHPDRQAAGIRGSYRLVNRTAVPIDSVHLSSMPQPKVRLRTVRLDRGAGVVLLDTLHGYRIYALERPLAPGDSLELHFEVDVGGRGFRNRESTSANTPLVGDFTHLLSRLVLPAVGYQRDLLELSSATARRAHGLPPTGVVPSIDDVRARRLPRSSPEADWIDLEATIGTTGDRIAIVPGALQRSWTVGDRRYFHYRTEQPILNGFAVLSARYAVHRSRWRDVDLQVLHHPQHPVLARTVRNVEASFEYLASQFGPYPHRQFTMVEFPRYGTFGRAYPGQMVFTENHPISLARSEQPPPDRFDAPLLTTAHELAHLWWGHQVMGADVQGSQVLSETLAQYSALMVLERVRGSRAAQLFVRNMQLAYLDGRGTHGSPEVPLLLSGNHEYLHYRKGAVVMYALQDYLGEARVNGALRRLVERHALRGPPYPTTRDLYRELQAVTPDSLRGLLDDLLTTITLWDLRTTAARAEPAGGGAYRVTIEIEGTKVRSDSVGNDTALPMDDAVDVGVFAAAGPGERLGAPLYLRKHRIRSGRQTITVLVPGRPARAAVDPYHKLVARHRDVLLNAPGAPVAIERRTPGAGS